MAGRSLLALRYGKSTGPPSLTETRAVCGAVRKHLAVSGTDLRNSVPFHKFAEDTFKNFYGKYIDIYVDKHVTGIFFFLNRYGVFP